MKFPLLPNRKRQLLAVDQLLRKYSAAIYVGAKVIPGGPRALWLPKRHAEAIDCWEIHSPNVAQLRETDFFRAVYEIDVVDAVARGWLANYGLLVWYHGPEHLPYRRAVDVCAEMLAFPRIALVLGCPWGVYEQGESDGNPHEAHKGWMLPEDFARLGYEVSVCKKPDHSEGGVLAWRIP